ncbi:MAG: hypothetical protein LBR20_08435 [Propionibacteriaceae bacterium]|jgi:hypothetical protein|nr:hypothetical protein [Propionibacteriaceae bacterium]
MKRKLFAAALSVALAIGFVPQASQAVAAPEVASSVVTGLATAKTIGTGTFAVKFTQVKNTMTAKITLPSYAKAAKKANKVTITATQGSTTLTVTKTMSSIKKAKGFTQDFPGSGKWTVSATYYKGTKLVKTVKAGTFSVTAPKSVLPKGFELQGPMRVVGSGDTQLWLAQRKNTTKVLVVIPNLDALKKVGAKLVLSAKMTYKSKTVTSTKITKTLGTATSYEIETGAHGKYDVNAQLLKSGKTVKKLTAGSIGVTADEYNIAPLYWTLPTTFFSLALFKQDTILKNKAGDPVPTYVTMNRPSAWNWDKLPTGVAAMPFMADTSQMKAGVDFATPWKDYVKVLMTENPDSVFHLYSADNMAFIIGRVLYANNVPQTKYTITMMSDGSFSATQFAKTYASTDPTATHKKLLAEWNAAKEQAQTTGKTNKIVDEYIGEYLWACIDAEPNAQWWLGRPDTLHSGDSDVFAKAVQAQTTKVVRVNVSTELTQIQTAGAAQIAAFKSLFNFSDEYFAKAKEVGKPAMVFIGTHVTSEGGLFGDYASYVMKYYGDQYVYYYKGHPATPAQLYPDKLAELEKLGIIDVDSSIPAELILFFNPDIYLSGYQSTTFASVTDRDKAKGLIGQTEASALALSGVDYSMMDFFVSRIDATSTLAYETSNPAVVALAPAGQQSYYVEFSTAIKTAKGYDAAIWTPATSTATYYKITGGVYSVVTGP